MSFMSIVCVCTCLKGRRCSILGESHITAYARVRNRPIV